MRQCIHTKSSHRRCYIKKGVLRNFVKFTRKHHLRQSLFFNKVAALRPAYKDISKTFQIISCFYYVKQDLSNPITRDPLTFGNFNQLLDTQRTIYNGIATTRFEFVLYCIEVLTKKYCHFEVLITVQKHWSKVILKSVFKF